MATFDDFNLDPSLMEGIDAMGYSTATPIQELTIPHTMQGRDLIACAQTGTGKTAAYLLPTMHRILHDDKRQGIHTLILAPTRELALQIDQAVTGFAYFCGISNIAVYGGGTGESFEREKKALMTNTDIIVATPGRLLAHLGLGYVNVSHLQTFILDEADRMLDMGFFEDIMRVQSYLPKKRQTLMFSATMPPRIRQMAAQLLVNPEQVNIAISKPAAGIKQLAYCVYDAQKIPLLMHLFQTKELISVIVFSSTKQNVKNIERELKRLNLSASAIHSDLEQNEREEVLRQFRGRNIKILVATDVLSRGIDIENISLVLNFDVPGDGEDYIHRVGRTARAESTGEAITFVTPADMRNFSSIENLIGYEVEKGLVPTELGETPVYNGNQPRTKSKGNFNKNRKSGGGKSFSGKKPYSNGGNKPYQGHSSQKPKP
jgi:ATP-dependent RNA helicase RhlE